MARRPRYVVFMTSSRIKAVIPAAGLGTRFLPATKAMPKEMLPVVDKPAIQYVVEEAVAAGAEISAESLGLIGRVTLRMINDLAQAGGPR